MKFGQNLARGKFIRRYKRFLVDVQLDNGELLTMHCPNTGSMKNCMLEGANVWYSLSSQAKRKYPHTWELATTPTGDIAGINTSRANPLVREAIELGRIPFLQGVRSIKAEVPYGNEKSRIDFVVDCSSGEYFVEVKSVTLCESEGKGVFPDSVSARGAKHLRELSHLAGEGKNAALIYCVQHTGINQVAPARYIDPVYCQAFDEAVSKGVRVIALKARISTEEIILEAQIPVLMD